MTERLRKDSRIRARRGTELRCKGWRQEAILRLLENNLENAENPDELVIYMSYAKAARDWASYDRIVAVLQQLETDQTLVVQSGKPIGVFHTQGTTPLVIMANGNLVGAWGDDAHFRELEAKGLTIMPGMTAAAWQYIGAQGILQGTYETFMAVGRQHFGGTLEGRWIVTGGCGGMSGAQPLAGYMAGAAILIVEMDETRIRRRLETGYCERMTEDIDQALCWCHEAAAARRPTSVAVLANVADVLPELVRRGMTPDIVTDQTTPDPLKGYYPVGLSLEQTKALRASDPAEAERRSLDSIAAHVRAMLELKRRGAVVFEYGNNLREHARRAGVADAFNIGSFVEMFIRPLFCEGIGPFRWIAPSGNPEDVLTIDEMILNKFSSNHRIVHWIRNAQRHVQFTGLPARIGWLGYGERSELALLVNEAVAEGKISAPIAFTRDHLDSGSAAIPFRETEGMKDGSDAISDWPMLNALLNCASGADLVALHGFGNWGNSAGFTVVADGSADAAKRLVRVLDGDAGIGVLRHADAGYSIAVEKAQASGLANLPVSAERRSPSNSG